MTLSFWGAAVGVQLAFLLGSCSANSAQVLAESGHDSCSAWFLGLKQHDWAW